MSSFSFIKDIFSNIPLLLASNTFLQVLAGLIGIVSIVSIAPVVDIVMDPELENASAATNKMVTFMQSIGMPISLTSFLATFLGLHVLKNGVQAVAGYSLLRTKYAILRKIMVGTFEKFFSARWLFFSSNSQGVLLNTFMREATTVGDAIGALIRLLANILQTIFYLFVPFFLFWQVMSISLITALVFAVPIILLGKWNYRLGVQVTSTSNQMISVIQEGLSAAKVILGYGRQHRNIEDVARAFDDHRRVIVKSQTLALSSPLMYEPLGLLVIAVTVLMAQRFGVSFGDMGIALWTLRQTIPSIGFIVTQRNTMINFLPSYEQIKNLTKVAEELGQKSGDRPYAGLEKEISFEKVSFAYPNHEVTLTDINLRIPKSKMIAIVGASGAGKSTIVDMIMGFNEPLEGRISVDNVPLEVFDIHSYRRRIGYVPQDSVLFNLTIRDNLLWAKEDASDQEIDVACDLANAKEFILEFPDGYDTLVGDRGVRLSGGQCQRIALARAILRQPDLLILDEATSSLDTQSERLIQNAIEGIAKRTTVVAIAHRLSTIANADYVYVLAKGRIVEEGTYRELASAKGHFSDMVKLQNFDITVNVET